jgi:hypothetical protein
LTVKFWRPAHIILSSLPTCGELRAGLVEIAEFVILRIGGSEALEASPQEARSRVQAVSAGRMSFFMRLYLLV